MTDVDDVGALAVANVLNNCGLAELRGVVSTPTHITARWLQVWAFLDISSITCEERLKYCERPQYLLRQRQRPYRRHEALNE